MRTILIVTALAACGGGSGFGIDAPSSSSGQPCSDFSGTDYALVEPAQLCNIDMDGIDYFDPHDPITGDGPLFLSGHRPDGSSGGGSRTRITNTTWRVDAVMWSGQRGKAVVLVPNTGQCRWMRCL